MGHNVFVSYKYNDTNVRNIGPKHTVRDYVNVLKGRFEEIGYSLKGETSDKDMSEYSEGYIEKELKRAIFPCSVTVILISPCMKDSGIDERSQWIPWEIEYSLKDVEHDGRTSRSNALVAVVLPDPSGSYRYQYLMGRLGRHFRIIEENMYNGYIETANWEEFRSNPEEYVEKAIRKSNDIEPAKASWRKK